MSYIYKIINLTNNKEYVGYTSRDYLVRFEEHFRNRYQEDNSLLHKAMRKYGRKNFKIEVLEEFDEKKEDWCLKEQYWIKKCNSLRPNGYNILPGGNKPPDSKGEKNPRAKINNQILEEIINDLKEYELNYGQIAQKYGISQHMIERINSGETWHNDNIDYPVRKMKLDHYRIMCIINDLKENILTQSEIEEKYHITGRTTLAAINNGKRGQKIFPQDSYPIRKGIINRKPPYLENL